MNVLVTGSNGQLGNEMRIVAQKSADKYIFTDLAELDITDPLAVERMVLDHDIKVIINCAAYTDVDKAEENFETAELINSKAVENLARSIRLTEGVLVHVSTDYVFGGTPKNTPYIESDPADPTGVYGMTKLHGEQAIQSVGCHYIIIRTSWLYSEFGRNFLKTMMNLTSSRPKVKVVFDQVGTPTYAFDLAQAIFQIVEGRLFEGRDGIYHYSNEGVCSWFDFSKFIARYSGFTDCEVEPCHSSEFPSKVVRPSYSVLDKTKIKECFGISVPYWTDSLKNCIDNLKKEE